MWRETTDRVNAERSDAPLHVAESDSHQVVMSNVNRRIIIRRRQSANGWAALRSDIPDGTALHGVIAFEGSGSDRQK
jgi:hypothetical protein